MLKGITDPQTNKTYIYKGFTPLSRISLSCSNDSHATCVTSPQNTLLAFGFELTKKICCLCDCHFQEEVK